MQKKGPAVGGMTGTIRQVEQTIVEVVADIAPRIAAGESAPTADPDKDGLTNLAEYALGGLPDEFTPQPILRTDYSLRSFTFQRPRGLDDIIYHAEVSENASNWSELELEILNPGFDPETVRASPADQAPQAGRLFFRLRFDQ